MATHPRVGSRGEGINVSQRQSNKVTNYSPSGVYDTQTRLQTPQRPWPLKLWTRNAFIVACITALISSLYWARTRPILFTPQEPQENGPAFIVRDLPGKGKGMIALRDIRVGASVHGTGH